MTPTGTSYHLIMHGDLQGYSPREVEVIANIARYHRKAAPKKRHPNFGRLDRPDRRLVKQLSSILRVADGLDRTHTQRVRAVACDLERGGRLRLVLDAESDPRVEIWDAERKGALFAEVFDIRLSLVWRKALRRGARSPARQRPTHLRIATG